MIKNYAEKHLNKLIQMQPIITFSESSPHFDTTSLADKQSPSSESLTITKGPPGQK